MRKLTYFVGMSLDGFIAAPDHAIDAYPVSEEFLNDFLVGAYPECLPTHVRTALGADEAPNTHFDTMIQGRTTYQAALDIGITSPYAHLRQYVVSRSLAASPDPAVELISGDLAEKVRELKVEEAGLGIYLGGGAEIAGQLLDEIDELVLKVYPVVLGDGIRVFTAEFGVHSFSLDSTRSFENGTVVLTYSRLKG
ncbi:dihydrofolate reductase family protein [Streptomyces sp. NBC_00237]|uniref:dihydrofolate reductase family protein n=1 Tax=Streptomyces sp. NBC_00237 TaxID=2975687 RepID=UPI00225A4B25|nr:dihydrofolate reductase family protein [Streptomyces sp. NBC_00237]MCX5204292.1 dihydrofolate reductase family protein [Streptomyces sp. NBC_00237]